MDETDRQLISLLRKDARTSVATLAAKLGVSRGTVTNRLRKLEDGQVFEVFQCPGIGQRIQIEDLNFVIGIKQITNKV